MSSWVTFEEFLHSKTARIVRRVLVVACIAGVGSDYYVMHYHQTFDPKEAQRYVINFAPVGKPRPVLHTLPNQHYTVYSPWTPLNGDVVLAKRVEGYPQWIQTVGGRFIERETCGVELCRLESEVLAERAAQQRDLADEGEVAKRALSKSKLKWW